jgi:hypothetical protein
MRLICEFAKAMIWRLRVEANPVLRDLPLEELFP